MREDAKKHREELIVAASRAFARHGYESPLQVVLDETYLTRGTLYRNFKDKDELFIAVLQYELEQISEFVRSNASKAGFFKEYLRRQSACASMHVPAMGKMHSDQLAQFLPQYKAMMDEISGEVLAAAKRSSEIGEDFTRSDLSLVVLMVAGPSMVGWQPSEAALELALKFLFDGLSRTDG